MYPDAHRDWSKRAAASDTSCVVSSAAISSNGRQSFNTQSLSGASSYTAGSEFSHISCGELYNQQSFKDLQDFSNSFSEPLLQAQKCMREVDESLVEGLEQVLEEAIRMVNAAVDDWLPHLCSLIGDEESHHLVAEADDLQSFNAVAKDIVAAAREVVFDHGAAFVLCRFAAGRSKRTVLAARREELGRSSYRGGSWEAAQSRSSPDKWLLREQVAGRSLGEEALTKALLQALLMRSSNLQLEERVQEMKDAVEDLKAEVQGLGASSCTEAGCVQQGGELHSDSRSYTDPRPPAPRPPTGSHLVTSQSGD
eukprot:s122_g37.t1